MECVECKSCYAMQLCLPHVSTLWFSALELAPSVGFAAPESASTCVHHSACPALVSGA